MTLAAVYRCPNCYLDNTDPDDVARQRCRFCDLFREDLRGALVTELRAEPYARGLTRRDCWGVAIWTAKHHGDAGCRVVHGGIRDPLNPDSSVQHAWVETPGVDQYDNLTGRPVTIVVDYCQIDPLARILEKQRYYDAMGVVGRPPPKRYTLHQCLLLCAMHRNNGPWDEPGE